MYEENRKKNESISKNLAWFVSIQLHWNWILVTVGGSGNICICCCCLFPFTSIFTTMWCVDISTKNERGSKDYDFRLRKWFLFKQISKIHICSIWCIVCRLQVVIMFGHLFYLCVSKSKHFRFHIRQRFRWFINIDIDTVNPFSFFHFFISIIVRFLNCFGFDSEKNGIILCSDLQKKKKMGAWSHSDWVGTLPSFDENDIVL